MDEYQSAPSPSIAECEAMFNAFWYTIRNDIAVDSRSTLPSMLSVPQPRVGLIPSAPALDWFVTVAERRVPISGSQRAGRYAEQVAPPTPAMVERLRHALDRLRPRK